MALLPAGRRILLALSAMAAVLAFVSAVPPAFAQTYGPYSGGRTGDQAPPPNDSYQPPANDAYQPPPPAPTEAAPPPSSPYRPSGVYREDDNYRRYDDGRSAARDGAEPGYGEPYHAPDERYDDRGPPPDDRGYSQNEIIDAGGRFFGSVSKGLAEVIEHAFAKSGRPNGYILGEDAGGAFVAGLRYGGGTLYTKDAGTHPVYWQGPSIGYDFGGEGSKTMVLVYNLRDPSQIYERFAGVQGSAYVVGGVGIQWQTHGNVTLAPIRAGIGLRLGANVGYLKYTRSQTWNPF